MPNDVLVEILHKLNSIEARLRALEAQELPGISIAGGNKLTIPATGTAALLGTAQTFTAAQTINADLRITGGGGILTGTTTRGSVLTTTNEIHSVGISTAQPAMQIYQYSNDGVNFGFYDLLKSRGTSVGTKTIVQAGDTLGNIRWLGANGTDWSRAAIISAIVDGTPGATNDMPGALLFWTTPDGSGTPAERVRITSTGRVGIAETTPTAQAHICQTSTTAAIPVLTVSQADVDEEFIEFTGTSTTGNATSISTSALGTYQGRVQITVNGTRRWIPFYADA
jgi:hypothetical protein